MAGTATISTIKHDVTGVATTFKDGSGNEIGQLTKGWVNYKGSTTQSIRGSFNCSSATRNSTGDFLFNLSLAVTDTNATITTGTDFSQTYSDVVGNHNIWAVGYVVSTTLLSVKCCYGTNYGDNSVVGYSIFR